MKVIMKCKYENCEEIIEGNNLFCDKHMKDVLYEVFGEPKPEGANAPELLPAVSGCYSGWINSIDILHKNIPIGTWSEYNRIIVYTHDGNIEFRRYYNGADGGCWQIEQNVSKYMLVPNPE